MKKTVFAMVISGLMAVGVAGCGGGSSTDQLISDMCNKMDSCGQLKSADMTVSDCTKAAEAAKKGDATAAQTDAAKKCLAMECSAFESCLNAIP